MTQRVAIIGAGVSGLTCGVELQRRGYDVTLFKSDNAKAASEVAAAIWYPYDIHPAQPWADESYEIFRELAHDPATGVSMVAFHLVDENEMITVPLVETPVYLPWLARGLNIVQRTIASFEELADFDLIVNCAGLGARAFCSDEHDLHAGRGVVLKAPYSGPPIHVASTTTELTYVLTRRNDVILGGTNDFREDDEIASEITDAIFARCAIHLPSLPEKYVTDVGFRPLRSRVRLERDGRVIHNYGHGGAGITVSWACAREVADVAGQP